MGTQETYEILNRQDRALEFIKDGYNKGLNLSRQLEEFDPSDPRDELDTFDRLMQHAGIVTRSDPAAGYWASPVDEFYKNTAGRVLFTEFFARTWRRVAYAGQRALYLYTDAVQNSWQRPYTDAATPRWDQTFRPAIPLSEVVALTTPITGTDYRAFYLTYDAAQLRRYRVGESAEIPMAKLTDSERTIQLQKYGRGIRATYEQLRRARVDKLAWMIAMMAVQAEADKVVAAMDVLVNGDGNVGTAPTTHQLTLLDTGATAGTLTTKGWLAFKLKFANPYIITTALMQEAVALQLMLLNVGTANVLLSQLNAAGLIPGDLTPINLTSDGVRYGWTSDAPTLKIVGFDRRMAIEQVVEIGGQIDEMERYITNQTQIITMTEVMGFATLDPNATEVLDVNA